MSEWYESFKAALLTYIRNSGHADAEKIVYWDEEVATGDLGGCDTCGWGADDAYTLTVYYDRADGTRGRFVSTTPFGELIVTLSES